MIDALLFSAMLLQPECLAPPSKIKQLAAEITKTENRHNLPRGLLAAVVLAESGGRKIIVRGRGKNKKGCDVGEGQIHVSNCNRKRMQRLLTLTVNLEQSALILDDSRKTCMFQPLSNACRRSKWAGYNSGSKYWWKAVKSIWDRIKRYATMPIV